MRLFKKLVISAYLAAQADILFQSTSNIGTLATWLGVLAFTLQIYFDFSSYSDMATGLAKMFGITLPMNFNSPYKALNVSEFWRRWNISLSRFLKDYLYIPVGAVEKGIPITMVNLMITMLLGGLWHGAAWTFVLWGLCMDFI